MIMKHELTKEEAKEIWSAINYNQNVAMHNLGKQLEVLDKLDKQCSKDKIERFTEWLDESADEWDKFQTIKAKMVAIIKGE